MTRIEEAVAQLPFEKDPYFPYQYSKEEIAACEALIDQPFPEDLRWYLRNVGWRKIDYDHRSILVKCHSAMPWAYGSWASTAIPIATISKGLT